MTFSLLQQLEENQMETYGQKKQNELQHAHPLRIFPLKPSLQPKMTYAKQFGLDWDLDRGRQTMLLSYSRTLLLTSASSLCLYFADSFSDTMVVYGMLTGFYKCVTTHTLYVPSHSPHTHLTHLTHTHTHTHTHKPNTNLLHNLHNLLHISTVYAWSEPQLLNVRRGSAY